MPAALRVQRAISGALSTRCQIIPAGVTQSSPANATGRLVFSVDDTLASALKLEALQGVLAQDLAKVAAEARAHEEELAARWELLQQQVRHAHAARCMQHA
eukprot:22707-Chlamydomonas_euryale.AAC.6